MKRTAIASLALIATLVLAGCSASSDMATFELPADGGMAGGEALLDQGAAYDDSNASQADAERSQIITGYMSVTAENPAEAAGEAIRIVEQVNGRVDGRQEYAPVDGNKGSASLTLRIPAESLDSTLEKLGELGEVIEISTVAENVTAQVKDVDSRVKSLQASVDRLTALLATATDVDQLVSIESSLTSRQGDLESMLTQQRSLADQVSLATITLSFISEADAPPPPAPVTFLTGLETGWNAFTGFIGGLVVVIGVLIPWLVFFGIIAAVVIVIVRMRRKRRAASDVPAA